MFISTLGDVKSTSFAVPAYVVSTKLRAAFEAFFSDSERASIEALPPFTEARRLGSSLSFSFASYACARLPRLASRLLNPAHANSATPCRVGCRLHTPLPSENQ
eukprot:6491294-Prymnesium_polylepis.1